MSYNPSVQGRKVLRASATALAAGTYDSANIPEFLIQNCNTVALLCDLTLNTATSVEIQVDCATPDNSPGTVIEPAPVAADWYTLAHANVSGLTVAAPIITAPYGHLTIQLAATGKYLITLKSDAFGKYLRVRAKTTAGPGLTTLGIIGVSGLS